MFRGPLRRHLLSLLLPSQCLAQQDGRRKQSSPPHSAFCLCWHSPPHHSGPFGGKEIINPRVILRGMKSLPFREENILCYVTGSDLHSASLPHHAGLSTCVPLVCPYPKLLLREPWFFSKANKWQFENSMVWFREEGLLFLPLERGMFMWKKAFLEALTLYSRVDRWSKICIVS